MISIASVKASPKIFSLHFVLKVSCGFCLHGLYSGDIIRESGDFVGELFTGSIIAAFEERCRIRTAEFAFGIAVVCRGGGGSDGIFDFTDETVVISVCGEDLSCIYRSRCCRKLV